MNFSTLLTYKVVSYRIVSSGGGVTWEERVAWRAIEDAGALWGGTKESRSNDRSDTGKGVTK